MADADRVVKLLKEALKAVDSSGVPAELRPAAFREAIRLLSSDLVPSGQPRSPSAPPKRTEPDSDGRHDHLAALANGLGLSHDVVSEVYHFDAGDLKLIVAPSKLEADKAGATKQIALLISAGRQGSGIDSTWTPSKVIRDVCEEFGKFDSANFAAVLGSMGDVFGFDGRGRGRKVKVNRPGFEQAGTLIKRLTAGAQKK
jgi:hypothetical protein